MPPAPPPFSTRPIPEHQAGKVQASRPLGPHRAVPRQDAPAEEEQGEAHRHVDEEHRPPDGAEQVGTDQDPAEHLPGGGTHRDDRRAGAERPGRGRAGRPGVRR
ncbi:hypothetical protein GCM10010129_10900 [Streptomyces fumigatiscleroticus]|nr:hypothetical protein GCM10010129_10900 [Streptomyces fumigatiscleroticus]